MELKKEFNNKKLVIKINGRVDTYTAPELSNVINNEIEKIEELVLDFTDLEYISSAGLRVLISTQKKANKENLAFKIKNVNKPVGEILRMSKFDKILNIE